jgi:hypothetical protein
MFYGASRSGIKRMREAKSMYRKALKKNVFILPLLALFVILAIVLWQGFWPNLFK